MIGPKAQKALLLGAAFFAVCAKISLAVPSAIELPTSSLEVLNPATML